VVLIAISRHKSDAPKNHAKWHHDEVLHIVHQWNTDESTKKIT
jgi:hypothetical protein